MRVILVNEQTGKRVFSRKEVAKMCGVSTQTLRVWEEAGYIPTSVRDENDYRYWYEEDIAIIKEVASKSIKERKAVKRA